MYQMMCSIDNQEQLAEDIFKTTLNAPEIALSAKPGQFVMVRAGEQHDPLLRRPFSIHQVTSDGRIKILFKVVGKGTEIIARKRIGEGLDLVGPLGNGFKVEKKRSICLVGGGMGIAPLLFLGKEVVDKYEPEELVILLGARNRGELEIILEDFKGLKGALIDCATDDGSLGHKGLVVDLLERRLTTTAKKKWRVLSCGPLPMMAAVAAFCRLKKWSCQVSMETMMACGISACLGCTVRAMKINSKGGPYLHVCQDGPVFLESEILWNN